MRGCEDFTRVSGPRVHSKNTQQSKLTIIDWTEVYKSFGNFTSGSEPYPVLSYN